MHVRKPFTGSLACTMFLRMFNVRLRGWPAAIDVLVDVLTYASYISRLPRSFAHLCESDAT